VDTEGKPSRYSSSGDRPFIEYASENALRAAVKDVIENWVEEQQATIRAALVKKLSAGKNELVRAMANGCAAAMIDGWRFEFTVKTDRPNR
jgi:hypothetical protein